MVGSEKSDWTAAIEKEIPSLLNSGTIIRSELPEGRRAITSKFVLKRKIGVDGNIKRLKARVVAHGNMKVMGIDFDETFAPVVDWEVTLSIITIMVGRKAYIVLLDF